MTPEVEETSKNDINELLLGDNEPSSKGKKFFLIAAGVLLIFFIALGAMRIIGGSSADEKQPVSIAKTDDKKAALSPQPEVNMSSEPNATTDEKLNEIVQKLQQEAATQAKVTEVAPLAPQPKAENKVASAPKVQVPQAQAPTVAPALAPVKNVPIKQAESKEQPKQASPKAAMAEAAKKQPKPVPAPKPQQPKPAPQSPQQAATPTQGPYYIQVGAFDMGASVSQVQSKAQALGFSSIVKQVQTGDKTLQKVQVGPFATKQDAVNAITKAREINSGAFIVKSAN